MTAARSYFTILFALTVGGTYAAAAPGCVIQATDCDECDEEGVCHSYVGNDGMCYCDPGYEWSDADMDSFDCDRIPPKPDNNACVNDHNVLDNGECLCACGFTWCSDNPDDLTCCAGDNLGCEESETDVLMTTAPESSGESSGSTGTGEESGTGTTGGSTGGSTGAMEESGEATGSGSGSGG